MTRKFTFLLMALLALAGFKSWGQETILSESFEHDGSFPEGWTATHNNANGTGWYLAGTDDNIGSGYSGWSAFCKGASYSGPEDYLTTYAIDFSGYMSASLSFYYTNRQWYSDINQIRVEYSSSTDGSWTILWSNTTGTGTGYGNWIQANNINLSALCGGTYYLRFVNVDKYGYGIAIDNILITGIAGGTSYNITYDNTIQHGSISGPATAFANQTVTLTATPDENYALDHFTVDGLAIQGKTFTMPEHDVTVSAIFKQVFTLTVNDGTSFAEGGHRVPFRAEYASNYYTKSEFIIPLGDLEAMRGGIISSLTFYTSNYTNDCDFPNASWDVYVMEADYTLPGGPLSQDGTKFTDVASMTKVYSGPMSVKNHQMTIVLDAPIVYNSKNLIISFQQTSKSNSYVNAQWYGKNEGSAYRSRGGSYNDSNFTSVVDVASKPFLPKTTFTYMPGATYTVNLNHPEVGGSISAEPTTDVIAGTTVTLSATPATGYEFGEWTVINSTTSQEITVTDNQFEMPESDVTVTATFEALTQRYVNISQTIEHGTVTATPNPCYKGETVSLTFDPADGYSDPRLDQVTVTDANGGVVSLDFLSFTFTMPDSDVTVSATFNKNYSIVVGNHEHSDVYVGLATVAEGNNASFQVTPAADYQIESVSVVYDGGQKTLEPSFVASGTYVYNFTMPSSDVTINVEVSAIQYVVATVGILPSEGIGTCNVFEETGKPLDHLLGGETIYVNGIYVDYDYIDDYVFESVSVVYDNEQHTEIQLTSEEPGSYSFQMPTCNVTIKVSFRELQSYTINYYVNGEFKGTASCKENAPIDTYTYRPYDVYGVNFEGWGVAPIGTYVTEKPTIIGDDEHPTQNYDLHAVFSYSETLPAAKGGETWEKVTSTSELSAGDEIVFVYNNLIMCNRENATYQGYPTTNVTITDNEITSLPSNTAQFTLVENNGYWKLQYEELGATRFLATSSVAYDLASDDLYQSWSGWGYDVLVNWTAVNNNNSVIFKNDNINNYIGYYTPQSQMSVMGISTACQTYKKGASVITNTYYMTSVLTNGEIAENTTAKNIIISSLTSISVKNGATLTMDANGLFRNEDAANFVFEDGAQFYYTGTETVKAAFQKNITGYGAENTQTRDGYYLIANPTANALGEEDEYDVLDGCTQFDLYTFNPAAALEWINIGSTSQKVTFERNVGYLFAVPSDRILSFRGSLLPAGEPISIDLEFYEGEETGRDFPGFNLVGNPFACNAYVEGYNFYRMVDGELQTAVTSATIAPCEGFFVEATTTGQSVSLSTTAPATASQAMSLTVSQNRGNVIDRAIVNFNDNNDLHKFMMNPAHTNLSIAKGGETFAAISTEAEGELPVNFKAEKNGTYTITVNTENVEANYLHLIDNLTGMDTDLLSTPSYTFNATTSDYASRFKLVFSMNNNEEMSQASSFAYINNGEIIISNEGRATLQVIDVMGRIVSSEEINGECRISTNGLTAGLYILNLNGMTQKIVVK